MSKLITTEEAEMPKSNGQEDSFIRVSKWIPSRQRGLRGFIYVQGNLDIVTNAMLAVGAKCGVRTRQGWVDGGDMLSSLSISPHSTRMFTWAAIRILTGETWASSRGDFVDTRRSRFTTITTPLGSR